MTFVLLVHTPKYGTPLSCNNLILSAIGISVVVVSGGSVMFSYTMFSGLIEPLSTRDFTSHWKCVTSRLRLLAGFFVVVVVVVVGVVVVVVVDGVVVEVVVVLVVVDGVVDVVVVVVVVVAKNRGEC